MQSSIMALRKAPEDTLKLLPINCIVIMAEEETSSKSGTSVYGSPDKFTKIKFKLKFNLNSIEHVPIDPHALVL